MHLMIFWQCIVKPTSNVQFPRSQINNLSVKFLPIKIFLTLMLKSTTPQIMECVNLWN